MRDPFETVFSQLSFRTNRTINLCPRNRPTAICQGHVTQRGPKSARTNQRETTHRDKGRRKMKALAVILIGVATVVPHAVSASSIRLPPRGPLPSRSPSLGHTQSVPWSDFYPSESAVSLGLSQLDYGRRLDEKSSAESSCYRWTRSISMPLDPQV